MTTIAAPVRVPDSKVVVNKSGQYRYVHRVLETFRDENGRPTNKKVIIGTLVKDSNDWMHPNQRYFQFYPHEEELDLMEGAARRELKLLDSTMMGGSYLVSRLFQDLNVTPILNEVFGSTRAEAVLSIASYMACRGNVIENIEHWSKNYTLKPIMTPSKASLVFSTITFKEIMDFFKAWISVNSVDGCLAFDITSLSTYAKEITNAKWGYNRDGESLPQINLGCYLSFDTNMPLFYVTYQGSIIDKSNMKNIMVFNKELGIKNANFVMDRGFCSTDNITWLHSEEIKYIMAVETFHKTTRSAIDAVRGDIDDYKYNCGENTYGRKISSRSYGVRGNMHVFYSKELNIIKVGELYRKIDILNNELEQLTKITTKDARKYNKYYDIKVEKNGEFAYQINYDKIQEIQKYLGYFCLYTNTDLSTDKILSIYKQRDIIEKTYDDVKNYIDMKRMRTHNDKTTNGKLFCVFIALIAINSIGEKVKDLNDKKGRRRITKQSLIQELEGIKIVSLTGGNHLMNSLTKDQKDILKVFRITEDELLSYTQVQPRPPLGEAQSAPSNSA